MTSSLVLSRAMIGVALALGLGLAGWSFLTVYSPQNPYRDFLAPTRRFLRAGLALDSAALAAMEVEPSALRWALDTGRGNPALLRALESGLHVGFGARHGDRTVVFFRADSLSRCSKWPLTIRFSGPPRATRIEEVTAGC
jgi:hypothetical protein